MIKTLRTRLLIGITPLLAITIALGLWGVGMFYRLGGAIDVILRENYRSVLAAQNMKESLERIDSALLFATSGQESRAKEQFAEFRPLFERNLKIEQGNVTIEGEQALADDLAKLYGNYLTRIDAFFVLKEADVVGRTKLYFSQLLPTFNRIKDKADAILSINQANMEQMDRQARATADASIRWMTVALIVSAAVATIIAVALSRSLLVPIRAVTHAARGMARGDLEQVVPVSSKDELGELGAAFNSMATTIREFNLAGTAKLMRAQKTAQATIDSFPDPVVVVDPAGTVERANPAARRLLGATPTDSSAIPWSPPTMLKDPLNSVLKGNADFLPTSFESAVCLRDDGQERFLLPRVLAIHDEHDALLGAAVVMSDVTRFRMLDQLKSDMVSTVSHELKTPLTSMQMVVHLLLEEVVGPLTSKQIELLLAARQDSERLLAMVNDLMDLTRIEQGRVRLDLAPEPPSELVSKCLGRFEAKAKEKDIMLAGSVDFGLPPVNVDQERIDHVFDNLVGNALKFTPKGGTIRVTAKEAGAFIEFAVTDTGEGIPPEHLGRIFEKFYRVPGSSSQGGAGLGLAIVREILASHGGSVDVASEPGRGSTFSFRLPISPSERRNGGLS